VILGAKSRFDQLRVSETPFYNNKKTQRKKKSRCTPFLFNFFESENRHKGKETKKIKTLGISNKNKKRTPFHSIHTIRH
jgi:hypothetical protein